MADLQQELLAQAKQGMLTSEGAKSLHEGDVEMVADVITASIIGGAWAAMDEHGTGHMMDRAENNPALNDYIGSEAWNPSRTGFTVVGRPAGTYTNIFGERVTSKGKMEGREIEYPGYQGKHAFVPVPPSHAIETAMRWMKNGRMKEKIKSIIAFFPFGKYIITTKR